MKIYKILDGIAFFVCVGLMVWSFFAKIMAQDVAIERGKEIKRLEDKYITEKAQLIILGNNFEIVKKRLAVSIAERDMVYRVLLEMPENQIRQNWVVKGGGANVL